MLEDGHRRSTNVVSTQDNSIVTWLAMWLQCIAQGITVPNDLTYGGIRRVTTHFENGHIFLVVSYIDGTMVKLETSLIYAMPGGAAFDPPLPVYTR